MEMDDPEAQNPVEDEPGPPSSPEAEERPPPKPIQEAEDEPPPEPVQEADRAPPVPNPDAPEPRPRDQSPERDDEVQVPLCELVPMDDADRDWRDRYCPSDEQWASPIAENWYKCA